ncbi:MAG: mannosyl-oligosaccharide alpha-1,2-mannosidase [Cirrosporium novae-zelandiae]|nr:MAG: mannosyl-oligosaccharide alpha-1,2-mannosidase [Cirrosporium novae-zelandiae]
MAFNIPRNVPAFDDPQRGYEDAYWRSSRHPYQNGYNVGGNSYPGNKYISDVSEKLGGFFGDKELPMYKDKPYGYGKTRAQRHLWRKKRVLFLGALGIVALLYWFLKSKEPKEQPRVGNAWGWLKPSNTAVIDWEDRKQQVKEAFMLSWDGYERYAWGYDEYHPLSKDGRQMIKDGMGWIIVDALDTLMIMNLTSRLAHARQWVSTTLDYDTDHEVNTFETTIRMLGGLLSAHYLSTTYPDLAPLTDDDVGTPGEDLYLEKATDLAERILGAFDSPSGIPYASVNLHTYAGIPSHVDGGASSTAEAASLQLEFKYLAKLTGEKNFWDKAEKVIEIIDGNAREGGLLPIYIEPRSGHFRGENIRLGSRGDSYYEYLIKQYLQTSKEEPVYLELWDEALAGVRKHLIAYSKYANLTVLGERPDGLHRELSPKMDHLVCFMPGTIALGATEGRTETEAKAAGPWGPKQESEMTLARELMKTCWGMYKVTPTGLAPEIAHFQLDGPPRMESDGVTASAPFTDEEDASWRRDYIIKSNDVHNLQRPETVESLFYMWRITGDEIYREWGWKIFKSFVQYAAAPDGAGFTSLGSVEEIPPPQRNNMESFWLAETLKYLYLLFAPNDLLPLDQVVVNTEAHVFPRFEMGQLLSTGWKRKPRDENGKLLPETHNEGETKVTVEKVEEGAS